MSKSKLHRLRVQRGAVMPDYEIIYLIPDGDGGATWCEDPAPGADMVEEDAIKYKRVEYIVELEDGVWLADLTGDPGRTCMIKNAKPYTTRRDAEYALGEAQRVRGFANATINEA